MRAALLMMLAATAICGEELKITSQGAVLAATLRLPDRGSPAYPAAVLVHGSGKTTRAMLDRLGDRLLAMGIAVLAYDKRGVGESTGRYSGVGPRNSHEMFDLLAADALAGAAFLRARKDIDGARIGLAGSSQAGWIMPLAASRSPNVKWVLILSGPAVSVGEEIAYSQLAGDDPGSVKGLTEAEIERRMSQWKGPHGYDPAPTLGKAATPMLWIQGGRDRSIPQAKTVTTLRKLQAQGRPFTIHLLPNLNHGLRDADTDEPYDFWPLARAWLRERSVIPPDRVR